MVRVAGVIDDPPGFRYTPPGVDVLVGGKLTSNNVAGSSHNTLQSFAVACDAVSKPGGSFQTSSAVSGRRGADVSSSALHMCERTM